MGDCVDSQLSGVREVKRHRWGDKQAFPHKSERQCLDCPVVKVVRHEFYGGRDWYWTEFWRDLDQIEGKGTPTCEPVEVAA